MAGGEARGALDVCLFLHLLFIGNGEGTAAAGGGGGVGGGDRVGKAGGRGRLRAKALIIV